MSWPSATSRQQSAKLRHFVPSFVTPTICSLTAPRVVGARNLGGERDDVDAVEDLGDELHRDRLPEYPTGFVDLRHGDLGGLDLRRSEKRQLPGLRQDVSQPEHPVSAVSPAGGGAGPAWPPSPPQPAASNTADRPATVRHHPLIVSALVSSADRFSAAGWAARRGRAGRGAPSKAP